MNKTKNRKNKTFAMPTAPAAIPPKPKTAAMIAMTKNSSAQDSIVIPSLSCGRFPETADDTISSRTRLCPCASATSKCLTFAAMTQVACQLPRFGDSRGDSPSERTCGVPHWPAQRHSRRPGRRSSHPDCTARPLLVVTRPPSGRRSTTTSMMHTHFRLGRLSFISTGMRVAYQVISVGRQGLADQPTMGRWRRAVDACRLKSE